MLERSFIHSQGKPQASNAYTWLINVLSTLAIQHV